MINNVRYYDANELSWSKQALEHKNDHVVCPRGRIYEGWIMKLTLTNSVFIQIDY